VAAADAVVEGEGIRDGGDGCGGDGVEVGYQDDLVEALRLSSLAFFLALRSRLSEPPTGQTEKANRDRVFTRLSPLSLYMTNWP